MKFFSKIGRFFSKLFGSAPSILQTASTTLTLVGPAIGEIYTLVTKDPGDAAEVSNVVSEVQADLAAASTLISQSHSSPGTDTYQRVTTILNSVKDNLRSLLVAGHIKNPETVSKVTNLVNFSVTELDAVLEVLDQSRVGTSVPASTK